MQVLEVNAGSNSGLSDVRVNVTLRALFACRGWTENVMKADIHPEYKEIKVICSCGNDFTTRSTLGEELHVEVCSQCHPFYTGKQKILDSGGRVDKFRRKYGTVGK
jgi:large subunit ribosomal protein L31